MRAFLTEQPHRLVVLLCAAAVLAAGVAAAVLALQPDELDRSAMAVLSRLAAEDAAPASALDAAR